MKKILILLYKPYEYLIYIPFLGISTIFFGSIAILFAFIINEKAASFFGGVLWAKSNAYMTPMFVKVIGKENIDKKQSYVIVSNHQSLYDIFALYGWLGINFKWIMKQELREIPALGISCEKVGHIFIDRSNNKAAIESMNAAKKKIINGTSVIFFPEGTRSADGTVGEFKKGAFKVALNLELPILPITIIGTNKILPNKSMDLFPGKAKIIIHKPVETSSYNDENIHLLMEKTKEAIVSGQNI